MQADWDSLGSSETYLGYAQAVGFGSPGNLVPDTRHDYEFPASLDRNHWSLSGAWTVTSEASTSETPGGRIAFRFVARDVNLVMGPRSSPVPFRVKLDGAAPDGAHGDDVRSDGSGALLDQRMYQLVRQSRPIVDRVFEIEFLGAGAQGFCFTFG